MILTRRSFLPLLAAPAIVRAASLMPVRALLTEHDLVNLAYAETKAIIDDTLYGQLCSATRKAFVPRLFVEIYRADPVFKLLQAHQ